MFVKLLAAALSISLAPAAPPTTAATQTVAAQVMQVVAHEDDDLFFMNPDVDHAITAGMSSVTVYVTAGEITGDGQTRQDKARNRQRAAQNAYATMAGVADGDDTTQAEWDGQAWQLAGKALERYTLRAKPGIQLVFMDLPDGQLSSVFGTGAADTVIPTGGLVTTPSHYAHADVVTVLRALLTTYRPTVLRAQDAEPDPRYYGDHADHIAAARFAAEAAAGYTDPLYQVNYRDYNIRDVPANLSPADAARKSAIVQKYYVYDQDARNSDFYPPFLSRMYYRYTSGTQWAARNQDGRAQAFVVRNGSVFSYAETGAGGWTGPVRLADAGAAVAPGLAVGRNQDGTLEVFALRLSDHHLLSLPQNVVGGDFRGWWFDLGNPNEGLANQNQVGTPAVAANADGRLEIFVKNGGGGVSTRYQTAPNSGWNPSWVDLMGSDLQDGLTAITNPQGRIELFGSTRAAITHWYQHLPNQGFTMNPSFPGSQPASPPHAALNQAGGIELAYRQPGNGQLMLAYQVQVGGGWASAPVNINGTGSGEAAMVTAPAGADARIMIFERDAATGLSGTRQSAPNNGYLPWQSLDGNLIAFPSATTDAAGRAVVFAIGATGVSARRQVAPGGNQPFGPWVALGT